LIKVVIGEKSRKELQEALELKHRGNFRENYLEPALDGGYIRLKFPASPNHPQQRYLLTEKGQDALSQ
jgi:hypothetical protein